MSSKMKNVTSLERSVADFLMNRDNTRMIDFTYGMKISPAVFESVAKAVLNNKIQVRYDRDRELDSEGSYLITNNTIVLSKQSSRVALRGQIIHESIHAYQDICGQPMRVEKSEFMAYVAQSIYEVSSGRYASEPRHIARALYDRYVLGKGYTIRELESAVTEGMRQQTDSHGNALYHIGSMTDYDGIGKKKRQNAQ